MTRGRLRRGTWGGTYQVGGDMSDLRWFLHNQAGSLLSLSRLLWQAGALLARDTGCRQVGWSIQATIPHFSVQGQIPPAVPWLCLSIE